MVACNSEMRERALRMLAEAAPDHSTQWSAIRHVAQLLGTCPETLRPRRRQVEVDHGQKPGVTSEAAEEIKCLRRENLELRRAHEIEERVRVVRQGTRPSHDEVFRSIDQHKDRFTSISTRIASGRAICFGAAPDGQWVHHQPRLPGRASASHLCSAAARRAARARGGAAARRKLWRLRPTEGARPAQAAGLDLGRDRTERLMRLAGSAASGGRSPCSPPAPIRPRRSRGTWSSGASLRPLRGGSGSAT